jgi:hypothetical protein
VVIDLERMQVVCANQVYPVTMKPSTREAFLAGRTDPLDDLLSARPAIDAVANRLGYA